MHLRVVWLTEHTCVRQTFAQGGAGDGPSEHEQPAFESFYDDFQQKNDVKPRHLRKALRVKVVPLDLTAHPTPSPLSAASAGGIAGTPPVGLGQRRW